MPHVCRVDLTRVSVLRHVPKKQIWSQNLCSPESKYWKQIHWSAPRRASPRGAIAPSREQNEALCVCHPPEGMEEWCLVYPMWKLRNSICLSQWGTEMFIPFRTWRTCYSRIIWKLKKSYLIISIIFTQFCEETICLSNFESWGNDMSWKFRNSYVYPILTVEALTCLSLSENWGYFIPFWKGGTDTRIPFFQQSPEDPVKLYNPAVKSPNGATVFHPPVQIPLLIWTALPLVAKTGKGLDGWMWCYVMVMYLDGMDGQAAEWVT